MFRYKKPVFSIRNKEAESDEKRIHFQRLHHNPKKMVRRPIWWLFVLLLVIVILLFYLNGIR